MKEIKNINYFAHETFKAFDAYVDSAHALSMSVSPDFRAGFKAGVSALRDKFGGTPIEETAYERRKEKK